VTWRVVLKVGLVLILFSGIGHVFCQNPSGEESASVLKSDPKGKTTFELKCAVCHGLDGRGGEHAPDIVSPPTVKALSDQGLLDLIHDGIPESGMPGFSNMSPQDARGIITYLRFMQGKSGVGSRQGDPVQGQALFSGKAGCSTCHQITGRSESIAGDLTGFARDHQAGEIKDAILRPDRAAQESAIAVARDGRKFSGMIRNEDNASLQLQDADGRFYLLMKSSLLSVQRHSGNRMPLDYGRRLSGTELNDVVAYILREAGASGLSSAPSEVDEKSDAQ
jgi:cytochrome c oxidase cbb3-type subunit 3